MTSDEEIWRSELAIFFFGLAAFGILVLFWNFFLLVYRSYLSGALHKNRPDPFRSLWIRKIKAKERALLSIFCPYFARLNPKDKDEFLYRMALFIFNKQWFVKSGVPLREAQLRISAAAAQLSFGFAPMLFDWFERILIYPKSYISRTTGKMHLGETNASGILVFSFEDLVEGARKPEDGVHLGLHELAHALFVENDAFHLQSKFLDPTLADRIYKHFDESDSEGVKKILRLYGLTNFMEFKATCTELFFENSQEFKSADPELYELFCLWHRQDPLNSEPRIEYKLPKG
jgi:Mlc titration factor MtfA (ptsG expression regulator)